MSPNALRELAKTNRAIEMDQKAAAFADVARWLMIGKGNLGNTLFEAQAKRASERSHRRN